MDKVGYEQCKYPEVIRKFWVFLSLWLLNTLKDAKVIEQEKLDNTKEYHDDCIDKACEVVHEIHEDNENHQVFVNHQIKSILNRLDIPSRFDLLRTSYSWIFWSAWCVTLSLNLACRIYFNVDIVSIFFSFWLR